MCTRIITTLSCIPYTPLTKPKTSNLSFTDRWEGGGDEERRVREGNEVGGGGEKKVSGHKAVSVSINHNY